MQALEGIRVLDLSRLLPGPYCTMLLADFGAEVIKIEEPERGDYARSFPPFLKDFGYWHLQLNRNKKSVVLDLKSEAGRKAFLSLVKTADVVVESYRPGVLTKLGIDYAAAKAVNPRIIYCSLTGYGKKGPLAKQADHDIGYVSLAGITAMSGEAQGKPAIPGVLMADMNASMAAGIRPELFLQTADRKIASILRRINIIVGIGPGQPVIAALRHKAAAEVQAGSTGHQRHRHIVQRNINLLPLARLLRMTQSNHNRHAC